MSVFTQVRVHHGSMSSSPYCVETWLISVDKTFNNRWRSISRWSEVCGKLCCVERSFSLHKVPPSPTDFIMILRRFLHLIWCPNDDSYTGRETVLGGVGLRNCNHVAVALSHCLSTKHVLCASCCCLISKFINILSLTKVIPVVTYISAVRRPAHLRMRYTNRLNSDHTKRPGALYHCRRAHRDAWSK